MTNNAIAHNHVAIIGSGFGGIATAIRLQQNGFHDFILLERANEIGGVWRDNDYPGAAVDVQCQLYSFSFAPNPHWRNFYAKQPEIHAYLKDVAQRFGLRRHLALDCAVDRLDWNPAEQLWHMQTTLTSLASEWPSSGRAPQRCSSFRPSSQLRVTSPSSNALRTGSCRVTTVQSARGPGACLTPYRRCSGCNG
jgi:phytoene dehydrogenase-like protein